MSYHVPAHNMLKWIILTQNLLYNYLNWHLCITTSWISYFLYSCCMHLFKSFYFLSIGSSLWVIFLDNTHGLSFHFYLYNVKEENAFYFENFEFFFLLFIANFSSNFYWFFGNPHGPSFHFCLHIAGKKNTNLKK